LMAGVTDGNGNKTDEVSITKDLATVRNVYQLKNISGQLSIVSPESKEKFYAILMEWIK
jgi:hypothetical protein